MMSKENIQKMAWNEPGNSDDKSKNQDSWGKRPNNANNGGGSGNGIPPELKEAMDKIKATFGGIFSGGKKNNNSGVMILLAVAFVIWILSGIYIVAPAERGVVLRFGHHIETTFSGPHWHLPYPIETVEIVDVETIRDATIGYRDGPLRGNNLRGSNSILSESLMLTKDENIINAKFAVQYRIKNAEDFLFNVAHPEFTLRQATESSIREVVGKNNMDFVLTEGRTEIVNQVEKLVQEIMDKYQSGILITQVTMKDAQPPDQVQEAFADVVKAQEDNRKFVNQAEAYRNDIIPKARGKVSRIIAEANAYKEQIVAKAQGETSRFGQILAEYEKAPKVTKKRMYLETMQEVLGKTGKIMVDTNNTNSIIMLPSNKLLDQRIIETVSGNIAVESNQKTNNNNNSNRNRRAR